MHDIFISFSFADQDIVEEIVNVLTSKYGFSCWICTRDIDGGKHYKALIPKAIDEAKVVVFIQSENALASKEIPKEIGMAFDADKTIIPFKLDQAQLQGELRYDLYGVEYIDATRPTFEQRIFELAVAIGNSIGKPLTMNSTIQANVVDTVLKSNTIACNEIFAGREGLMTEIHDAFQDRNVIFLHGMGGIGKSALACQYWRSNREFYNTVIFARYENNLSSLIADDKIFNVSTISRKMKSDNTMQTDEEYALDKLEIIKKSANNQTLIIIDNYDVVSDEFFPELVKEANYRVLVTTRCQPEQGQYYVIPVREINEEALKGVFIEYANPERTLIEEDDPGFEELFSITNRHTLTLELIAKYMDEKGIDEVGEMVELIKRNSLAALSDSEKKDGYEIIKRIFHMTSLNDKEKAFLRYLAIMPSAGVNQKMFKNWCGDVFSARSHLMDLSLIQLNRENKKITLHPIVREVVINELQPQYENCKDFIERCAMVGEDCIPIMWNLPYEQKATLLDCYSNILTLMSDITADTYLLFVNISYMYNYIGPYAEAIALHERIYEFACKHFGEYSKEAMLVLNRIGYKNSNNQLYETAQGYYKKAADWFVEFPDYYSREALSVIQGCAGIFYYLYRQTRDVANLEKAYEYYDKSIRYGEKMLEFTKDESTFYKIQLKYQIDCVCRNYFRLYLEEKKYELAESCLEKYILAIETYNKEMGKTTSLDMADYYRQYAKLKFETGNYGEAISALKKGYDIYLQFMPERNPRVLELLVELIECLVKTNAYEEAYSYLVKAIENAKSILLDNHPTLTKLESIKKEVEVCV